MLDPPLDMTGSPDWVRTFVSRLADLMPYREASDFAALLTQYWDELRQSDWSVIGEQWTTIIRCYCERESIAVRSDENPDECLKSAIDTIDAPLRR